MIYCFQHPKTMKVIEVHQGINEKHEYVDNLGIKWNRLFTSPQMSTSTQLDPFSTEQFVEKTGSQRGSVGDMMDRSAELSAKRAEKAGGTDPLRLKYFDGYAKKRRGNRHPSDPKRYERLSQMGASVSHS